MTIRQQHQSGFTKVSLTITWVAPSKGGSAITAYTLEIRKSDGSTYNNQYPSYHDTVHNKAKSNPLSQLCRPTWKWISKQPKRIYFEISVWWVWISVRVRPADPVRSGLAALKSTLPCNRSSTPTVPLTLNAWLPMLREQEATTTSHETCEVSDLTGEDDRDNH